MKVESVTEDETLGTLSGVSGEFGGLSGNHIDASNGGNLSDVMAVNFDHVIRARMYANTKENGNRLRGVHDRGDVGPRGVVRGAELQ